MMKWEDATTGLEATRIGTAPYQTKIMILILITQGTTTITLLAIGDKFLLFCIHTVDDLYYIKIYNNKF